MGSEVHVTPHPNGGWQVKSAGAQRAAVKTPTQQGAIDAGRKMAQSRGVELVIHGKNGRIRDKDSHGHDPFPPKDMR